MAMRTISNILIICVLLFSESIFAFNKVRYSNHNDAHNQQSYYVELLHLSLESSSEKYGPFILENLNIPMSEQRQIQSINDGSLDIMWVMTSKQREESALPIRIPLLKGLLGYRVLVIRENQINKFAEIKNTDSLKKLVAVQGFGWPDYEILQANGFNVASSEWYSTIFKSLSKGFYDYFPRSVIEVWAEKEQIKSSKLVIDKKNLLVYPTAIYFFVGKNNTKLAERIEYSLLQAITQGSFEQLFTNYPTHQQTFNIIDWKNRKIHLLTNPLLPIETPINNKKLWFQLSP